MLTRRYIRIKVMQVLYGFFQSEKSDEILAQKQLLTSIDRIYELYILLLQTVGQVLKAAKADSEQVSKRIVQDETTKYAHKKFIENPIINLIANNSAIEFYSENYKGKMVIEESVAIEIFNDLKVSDLYRSYNSESKQDFETEKAFVSKFVRKFIYTSAELINLFEDENIHWADDIELAKISALKTVNELKESSTNSFSLMGLYKDEKTDSKFTIELFEQTIKRSDKVQKLMEDKTKNWDQDRIAVLDSLLMKMALSEVLHFKTIPVKVSINEYIEISKKYSTVKSGAFINGILDNIVADLTKDKKIKKTGRGLVS